MAKLAAAHLPTPTLTLVNITRAVVFTFILLLALLTANAAASTKLDLNSSVLTDHNDGQWINTSNRNDVILSYQSEMAHAGDDPLWSGDRASCQPGTTSQEYRTSTLRRLNWFRAMAGVPATIVENQFFTTQAQETALMNSVSERISHHPDNDFLCRTPTAVTAAAKSNLFLGATGPASITGYIEDPGPKNAAAKHRNWILHPTLTQVGIGEIPKDRTGVRATNALYVVQDRSVVFGAQPTLREPEGFVAWPPSGYVPGAVVFDRWSFSLRHADFSRSTVSVSVGGQQIESSIEHQINDRTRAPFPSIVWNVPGLDTHPTTDVAVTVTVSNVRVGSTTGAYSYTTVILGEEPAPPPPPTPTEQALAQFIIRAYDDFLMRQPSTREIERWTERLGSGTTRLGFITSLAQSEEWTTVVVDSLYVSTLGRSAEPAGTQYWAGRLRTDMTVADVAAQLYGSTEYVDRAGSWAAWLNTLYTELMGRPGEVSGIAYWSEEALQRGSGSVALEFYQSEESRRRRVVVMYQQFLRRAPEPAGLEHWSDVLRSGDDLALASYLASSEEYFTQ